MAWYRSTFSDPQRAHIGQVFQPLGFGGGTDRLLVGSVETVVCGLGDLVGWFDNPRDRLEYAAPLVRKVAELQREWAHRWPGSVIRLHFTYQAVESVAYKLRNDPAWLALAVWAAQAQVAIAPDVASAMRLEEFLGDDLPGHAGYERLAILADKAHDDEEVIRVSTLARDQGWRRARTRTHRSAGGWPQRRSLFR